MMSSSTAAEWSSMDPGPADQITTRSVENSTAVAVNAPVPRSASSNRLTAATVMSAPIVTVSIRETLWHAWSLLYRSGFRHLVVVDGSRCVGVLDDRRIALEWPLGPSRGTTRTVGDVITGRVRCVQPGTAVSDLASIMLDERIDALPVVNAKGDVVGLVTASDLLAVLATPSSEPEPEPEAEPEPKRATTGIPAD